MRLLPYLLPALLLGCGLPDAGNVHLIGHGGSGTSAPMARNSAASLRHALEGGVPGVEIDVQLTADSVLVAYHDQDLSSLTGCSGLVNAHTWADLRGAQGCTVTGRDGIAQPLVRLDSLLPALARQHPHADFTLDCKLFAAGDWWPYLHAFANALVALDRMPLDDGPTGRRLHGRLAVECQVDDFLLLVQEKQPWMPLYLYAVDAEAATWRAVASRYTGIVVSDDRISARQVAFAQELGLEVTIFGDNDRSALRKRPDRLQSNDPFTLLRKAVRLP